MSVFEINIIYRMDEEKRNGIFFFKWNFKNVTLLLKCLAKSFPYLSHKSQMKFIFLDSDLEALDSNS